MNATFTGRWVSIEAAAASISVSRSTMVRLIGRGLVASSKVGTRRLISADSLETYLDGQRQRLAGLGNPGEVGLSPDPA